MYVNRNISWKIVVRFSWAYVLFYLALAAAVVYFHHHAEHHDFKISIPFLPLSTIGIAVAFYLSFKNNQSYDRFWEARKIWGGIVNYSRTWTNQVLHFVSRRHATGQVSDSELYQIQKQLVYRHIAWINALRLSLRRESAHSPKRHRTVMALHGGSPEKKDWEEGVCPFIEPDEQAYLEEVKNVPTQLGRLQGAQLQQLMEESGLIEDFRHMEMMRVLEEFYNLQGKCERINATPLPRQYSFFSKVFVWIFVLLLPFGLVGTFADMGHSFIWLTVPFSALISWIFMTMELVGDNSEDPFENFVNDVPMTALCNTIEIDLRQMLGETELPEKVQAVNGILM